MFHDLMGFTNFLAGTESGSHLSNLGVLLRLCQITIALRTSLVFDFQCITYPHSVCFGLPPRRLVNVLFNPIPRTLPTFMNVEVLLGLSTTRGAEPN